MDNSRGDTALHLFTIPLSSALFPVNALFPVKLNHKQACDTSLQHQKKLGLFSESLFFWNHDVLMCNMQWHARDACKTDLLYRLATLNFFRYIRDAFVCLMAELLGGISGFVKRSELKRSELKRVSLLFLSRTTMM